VALKRKRELDDEWQEHSEQPPPKKQKLAVQHRHMRADVTRAARPTILSLPVRYRRPLFDRPNVIQRHLPEKYLLLRDPNLSDGVWSPHPEGKVYTGDGEGVCVVMKYTWLQEMQQLQEDQEEWFVFKVLFRAPTCGPHEHLIRLWLTKRMAGGDEERFARVLIHCQRHNHADSELDHDGDQPIGVGSRQAVFWPSLFEMGELWDRFEPSLTRHLTTEQEKHQLKLSVCGTHLYQLPESFVTETIPKWMRFYSSTFCIYRHYKYTLADFIAPATHRPAGLLSTFENCLEVMIHLLEGLQAHHAAGVLLLDIKAENIFVHPPADERFLEDPAKWQIVFGDYGHAAIIDSKAFVYESGLSPAIGEEYTDMNDPSQEVRMYRQSGDYGFRYGTRMYRPPEVQRGSPKDALYGRCTDVFAMGLLLSELALGCRVSEIQRGKGMDPNAGLCLDTIRLKLHKSTFSSIQADPLSARDHLCGILQNMLNADHRRRMPLPLCISSIRN
jgi:hypothetical protein